MNTKDANDPNVTAAHPSVDSARSPLSVIDITNQTLRSLADKITGDDYLKEEIRMAAAHLENASRHERWKAVRELEQIDLEASLREEGR